MESGEVKQVHDICVLLGYGADAICPYMVFETCHRFRNMGLIDKKLTDDEVIFLSKNYLNYDDCIKKKNAFLTKEEQHLFLSVLKYVLFRKILDNFLI